MQEQKETSADKGKIPLNEKEGTWHEENIQKSVVIPLTIQKGKQTRRR